MKYQNIVVGKFIDRPNRFIAHIDVYGNTETVHVKNTGRCTGLLLPGCEVALQTFDDPKRKTKYDLISVYKDNMGWINIDSQAPNAVVKEWLKSEPEQFRKITLLKPEYTYGSSRIDFYLECENRKIFIEVKGCTLAKDGIGYFPDAPTERGVKHLHELTKAVSDGYECYIAFVISMPGIKEVLPNREIQPEFGVALDEAVEAGVKILKLPCSACKDELLIL